MNYSFEETFTMHVTPEDYETGFTREVTLDITPPQADRSVPHYMWPDLEVFIVKIEPECIITKEIEEEMHDFVKDWVLERE